MFDRIAIKIEEALGLLCAYLFCTKSLDWFKTLYVDDFNLFKSILISIAALIAIIFFALTIKKTHNIAKHVSVIYCWACVYLHFDALLKNWFFAIIFLFFAIIVLWDVFTGIQLDDNLPKSEKEQRIMNANILPATVMTIIMVISQFLFWLGSLVIS